MRAVEIISTEQGANYQNSFMSYLKSLNIGILSKLLCVSRDPHIIIPKLGMFHSLLENPQIGLNFVL
jgi:hypothetical protein